MVMRGEVEREPEKEVETSFLLLSGSFIKLSDKC